MTYVYHFVCSYSSVGFQNDGAQEVIESGLIIFKRSLKKILGLKMTANVWSHSL